MEVVGPGPARAGVLWERLIVLLFLGVIVSTDPECGDSCSIASDGTDSSACGGRDGCACTCSDRASCSGGTTSNWRRSAPLPSAVTSTPRGSARSAASAASSVGCSASPSSSEIASCDIPTSVASGDPRSFGILISVVSATFLFRLADRRVLRGISTSTIFFFGTLLADGELDTETVCDRKG